MLTIVPRATKNRELFALGMGGVFLAEAAVLRERKLFFHLFLVTLRIMRNAATSTKLELGHVVLDCSHTSSLKIR